MDDGTMDDDLRPQNNLKSVGGRDKGGRRSVDFVIRTTPLWGRTIYAFPQDLKS